MQLEGSMKAVDQFILRMKKAKDEETRKLNILTTGTTNTRSSSKLNTFRPSSKSPRMSLTRNPSNSFLKSRVIIYF